MVRDAAVREEVASSAYAGDNVRGAALVVGIVVGRKGASAFEAGPAAQNMMLLAANEGIGSCPNGIADADRLAEALEADAAGELAARYAQATPRGEVVLVIGGAAVSEPELAPALAALRKLVAAGAKPRAASSVVASLTGVKANALYRALMEDGA